MRTAIITTALVLASFATPAAAGTQKDIRACKAAIADQMGGVEGLNFKSSNGASLKRITFTAETASGAKKVVCKVKRGKVISID